MSCTDTKKCTPEDEEAVEAHTSTYSTREYKRHKIEKNKLSPFNFPVYLLSHSSITSMCIVQSYFLLYSTIFLHSFYVFIFTIYLFTARLLFHSFIHLIYFFVSFMCLFFFAPSSVFHACSTSSSHIPSLCGPASDKSIV